MSMDLTAFEAVSERLRLRATAVRQQSMLPNVVAEAFELAADDVDEAIVTMQSPWVRIPPQGVSLHAIEREALEQALRMTNGNQKAAAELLGVTTRVMGHKVRSVHRLPIVRRGVPRGRTKVSAATNTGGVAPRGESDG